MKYEIGNYKVRDHNGRFTFKTRLWYAWHRFINRTKWLIRVSGIVTAGAWLVVGGIIYDHYNKNNEVVAFAVPTAFAATVSPDKIKEAENVVMDEISNCETHGVKEADATIILDTNNQMSLGRYQFQIKTVQMYEKEMTGKDINRVDAIAIATDKDRATELVRYILFTDSAWNNWLNCSNKLDIATQVKLITKIAN